MSADIEFLEGEELYQRIILDTVLHARRNVWIATANVKDCRIEIGGEFVSIVKAFQQLCDRGVEVRLLHAGVPSGAFIASLKETGISSHANFGMRRCPRVHFKAVLVDDEHLHIGSANLTGAGLGAKGATRRNFEVGILTSSAPLLDRVAQLYHQVWEGRLCADCGRDYVCPVPLEEPDF